MENLNIRVVANKAAKQHRVVLKQDEGESHYGSFAISESNRERPIQGTIYAVSPPNKDFGDCDVQVGDKVLYHPHGGNEIEIDEETYLVMEESKIFVILNQKNHL
jgi:co-chaperonin GroES (HSP10)